MVILQKQSAFSVVVVGFQTLVLAPVGVLFKVHLWLGDLGVTRSDWRADPSGGFGSQRRAMAAGTCQEPLPPGRVL